jgi:malonyl CoA-acyl carrier protein transacylase
VETREVAGTFRSLKDKIMFTTIFCKKIWAWIKHYWFWPVIVALLAFSTITGTRAKEKLFEMMLKQKEDYKKELEIIKKVNEEKDLEKNRTIKEHQEELEKIEEEHGLKLEELEEEKRSELVTTIEENKDEPEKLAKEIARILSAEFHREGK